MRLEFLYQSDDLKEGLRWRPPKQRSKLRRALLGWILFLVMAGLLFVWVKSSAPAVVPMSGNPPPPQTSLWTDIMLPLIPWILILGFIWFSVIAKMRGRYRKVWENTPVLQQPQVLVIDEEGVRISSSLNDTLNRWPVFIGWAETRNLLLLLLPNNQRLLIPKRAAQTEAALQQLRDHLRMYASEPVKGFPVELPR